MSDTIQLINAAAVLVTAIGGVLVTVKVFLPMKRTGEITHTIVNQQRTDMQNVIVYQKQLIDQLRVKVEEKEPDTQDNVRQT